MNAAITYMRHGTPAAAPATALYVDPRHYLSSPFGGIIEPGLLLEIILVVVILISLIGN